MANVSICCISSHLCRNRAASISLPCCSLSWNTYIIPYFVVFVKGFLKNFSKIFCETISQYCCSHLYVLSDEEVFYEVLLTLAPWHYYYTTFHGVCQEGFQNFLKIFSMVFHARQHGELNPSHHVGPDATSHRPLTLLLYHRQSQKSIVLGKINKIIIFAKSLDKLVGVWYN